MKKKRISKTAQGGEELFRALSNCSPVGIFMTDASGQLIYTNARCQALCGITFKEILSENWLRFIHNGGRECWSASLHEGSEYSQEFCVQSLEGSMRQVLVRAAPMLSSDGELTGYAGTVEEIVEYNQAYQTRSPGEGDGKYKMLMEQASDGIHTYDLEGNFLEANARLCEMLGFTREELLGLNVKDLLPAEDIAASPIRFDDLLAGKTVVSERRLRRKDGTLLSVEISGKMIQHGLLQAIIHDITERKRVEETLREQEELLRNLLRNFPNGSVNVFDRDLRYLLAEGQGLQQVGLSSELLIGKTLAELYSKQAVDYVTRFYDRAFAGEEVEFELALEDQFYSIFAVPLRDRNNYTYAIMAIAQNITRQKKAESELKQSEEWLRAIFSASRDGIIVEENDTIIYANDSYARILGYEKSKDFMGLHISIVVSDEDTGRLIEYGKRRLRGETAPTVYEFKGKHKNGSLVDLEASVSTPSVMGKTYITTSIREIAKRKQAEQVLRQSQEELESRVHERTAELISANEILLDEIVERKRIEEERRRLLAQLVMSQEEERRRISLELHDRMGQHLALLMMGLKSLGDSFSNRSSDNLQLKRLDELSRQIEAEVDRLVWELRPTTLDDLGLHLTLLQHIEDWSEQSGIPVDYYSSGIEHERFQADIGISIYRITQEALTNILKHAEAQHVKLVVTYQHNSFLITIEDDGRGFEPDAIKKLSEVRTTLGLVGMRERAEMLGGTFKIEAMPGKGTTISIHLPLSSPHTIS